MLRANLREQIRRAFRIHNANRDTGFFGQWLHRFLGPLILRRVDRVDACVAELTRNLLRARVARLTQVDVGIVWIDDFLSVPHNDDSGDGPAKRRVVTEHDDGAQNREQHRKDERGFERRSRFGDFAGHA